MSWSPFVGIFIARISKGRSIREFVIAVLGVPTIISMFWFTTFGVTGIEVGKQSKHILKCLLKHNYSVYLMKCPLVQYYHLLQLF